MKYMNDSGRCVQMCPCDRQALVDLALYATVLHGPDAPDSGIRLGAGLAEILTAAGYADDSEAKCNMPEHNDLEDTVVLLADALLRTTLAIGHAHAGMIEILRQASVIPGPDLWSLTQVARAIVDEVTA